MSVIARVHDANKEILSLLKLLPQETQFASDLGQRNSSLQSELDVACNTIEALRLEVINCQLSSTHFLKYDSCYQVSGKEEAQFSLQSSLNDMVKYVGELKLEVFFGPCKMANEAIT